MKILILIYNILRNLIFSIKIFFIIVGPIYNFSDTKTGYLLIALKK